MSDITMGSLLGALFEQIDAVRGAQHRYSGSTNEEED